ncbi:hypothetical protein BURK_004202 [Burkholderia sp. SJ98]|nr:hypothetical protein BURK_004202 [Burkholderia sp. SJ98]
MSLDDRDWYREEMRRRNSARPKSNPPVFIHPSLKHLQSPPSAGRVKAAVIWLLILGGLYLLFSYAGRARHFELARSYIGGFPYPNRASLVGLLCVVFAAALIRALREGRRRKRMSEWQKAVYNPKEFRRRR